MGGVGGAWRKSPWGMGRVTRKTFGQVDCIEEWQDSTHQHVSFSQPCALTGCLSSTSFVNGANIMSTLQDWCENYKGQCEKSV